jgi:1L-myo-inositol 1-phosphate cytidylyltransferase / CDP-L-myo-inositol myo-inositolphosphotransferase
MSGRPLELSAGVILAAGSGLRLEGGPKPLAQVGGITLLERAVLTLRQAGVKRIIVVIGHAKDAVKQFVAERALDVELVENDDFSLGNGSSMLVGGRAVGGRFILTMVDHIVDPEAIARLLSSEATLTAAVDTKPSSCRLAEATKVRLSGERVVAVGRELEDYHAVDAGLFLCDAEVVAIAERAVAAGEGSWNAVKRRCLAEGRPIVAVDLKGLFWVDVDTRDDARRAERLLVERAAGKSRDGLVARYVNRHLSWRLSLLLIRPGISANAVTMFAFLLTLVSAGVLALGQRWPQALIAGGILVQISSVVDGVDGEIARASLRDSPAGNFLDSVLDRVGDAAVLIGLAVAAGPGTTAWAALVFALFGSLQVAYVRASYEASFERPLAAPAHRIGFGRDVRLFLVALSAVALQPLWGLVVVAVLANLEAARRFVAGWRARRP